MSIALGILLILALTAATGYFVAMEFAYVAVDRNALGELSAQGDEPAKRALDVTSRLSFTLSAAQFGITVTALLVGYVSEPLVGAGLADLLDPSMSYATRLSLSVTAVLIFSTVVQMVFGELAPKNLAIARTVPLARSLSRSTLVYLTVAGPVVRLFDEASTRLLRRIGIEPVDELEHGATAEDLTRIIDESHAGGLLDDDLSEVLEGGLRFRELDAGDVMTPRVRVQTVRADEPVSRLVELLDTGWSRFPVTGTDGDDIVGVAGIAEVLKVAPGDRDRTAVGVVTPQPTVVPTSAPLPRVLEQIRADHRQMAVVVDEHGGFAGIVTFEDIAEEVVGEILDEDDSDVPSVTSEGDDIWLVPGHLRLDELETASGVQLTASDEYSTISGLILESLGRTAQVGDVVDVDGRREADEPSTDTSDASDTSDTSPDDTVVDVVAGAGVDGHPEGSTQVTTDEDAADAGSRTHPPAQHAGDHEPARRLHVGVRLTVEEVDRHVPATVRVAVLGLLDDLERLADTMGDGVHDASGPASDDRDHPVAGTGADMPDRAGAVVNGGAR
ncbi:hemolysin family protein [Terracoccus luteus]|uniref:CBS domain containing-hemolysin-like protein n=1 Tax=Terracoccus luteus TaxID=53356 RepID=A0A839PNX5_9MICO|nr:hemolysin family protein [Terracoccus luteus]MBB2985900.1 CBS domain containing-hemolysin-like protein [Terracoccus luteus]MCP2171552.1 CBS domain containing-hemolysin-like protein [Terracoccus luteus]